MLHSEKVPDECAGMRLDQVLAQLFSDYSRSKLQTWIKAGQVLVNGDILRGRDKVFGGEVIELQAEAEPVLESLPQAMPLDIVFEDGSILIIHKPAGLVVHPGAGNSSGTLQNGLLHYCPKLNTLPRAGIIHRLDKDTSGLLMIAKTLTAHHRLTEQLQQREITREYLAIVRGWMTAGGKIDLPIGRHPQDRLRYCVREDGRESVTHYRVEQRFSQHSLIRLRLETGRTHQIRVHLAHIRYPIVGDSLYGGAFQLPAHCSDVLAQQLRQFKRQALHATKLGLHHPRSGKYHEWQRPMPADMQQLVQVLSENVHEN
ncbi:MAG: hypothetical protein RL637_1089 [Pseudomonadota bacterium]|jgi:23S rRNA pseudouridine1911/1915/1917 synthase